MSFVAMTIKQNLTALGVILLFLTLVVLGIIWELILPITGLLWLIGLL